MILHDFLDIKKDLIISNPTTNNIVGLQNNLSTLNISSINFSQNTIITGFSNGVDGKIILIQNNSSSLLTIKHNDTNSLTGNRIYIETKIDVKIIPNGNCIFKYDGSTGFWKILSNGKNELGLSNSWKYQINYIPTTNVSINSTTPLDISSLFFSNPANGFPTNVNDSPVYWDSATSLIRVNSNTTLGYCFNIIILFSGVISNSASTYAITFHRPDNTEFRRFEFKGFVNAENFTLRQVALIGTHIDEGGNDNFQLPIGSTPTSGGFSIKCSRISGTGTLNLNANTIQSIRFQR